MTDDRAPCPLCLERIREWLVERARIREREAESTTRDILTAGSEDLLRLLAQAQGEKEEDPR